MHHLDYCAVVEEQSRNQNSTSNDVCEVIDLIDQFLEGKDASNDHQVSHDSSGSVDEEEDAETVLSRGFHPGGQVSDVSCTSFISFHLVKLEKKRIFFGKIFIFGPLGSKNAFLGKIFNKLQEKLRLSGILGCKLKSITIKCYVLISIDTTSMKE